MESTAVPRFQPSSKAIEDSRPDTRIHFEQRPASKSEAPISGESADSSATPRPQSSIGSSTATSSQQADAADIARATTTHTLRVLRSPAHPIPAVSFVCLQRWQGTVLHRNGQTFTARLVDLTGDEQDDFAELSTDEVAPGDIRRLVPGAVFTLATGYARSAGGQRTRQTALMLQDLPIWNETELATARGKAREMKARFASREG